MKTDIEIARSIALQPIDSIAQQVGLPLEQLEHYGRYLAKVDLKALEEAKGEGKLILVTAITPTKAGIGKTTVSIGLSLGMNRLGRRAVVALREPSLGPCFGQKGGAAGGGYAQVLPMETITLHFTGDFHAITVLLLDAIKPNLAQTTEHTPAFIHGGPFANIAHGCNSILATRLALAHSEYTITEAGFGADLGAEKFYNIKCRAAGLSPALTVLVATLGGLKMHGGVAEDVLKEPSLEGVRRGLANLDRHIENLRSFGQTVVVAFNRFSTDTDEEIALVAEHCAELGVGFAVNTAFGEGGKGAEELARLVIDTIECQPSKPLRFTYPLELSIQEKAERLSKQIYGARSINFSAKARRQLERISRHGWDRFPICVAKTQYSFSEDPKAYGSVRDFDLEVRDRARAGDPAAHAWPPQEPAGPAYRPSRRPYRGTELARGSHAAPPVARPPRTNPWRRTSVYVGGYIYTSVGEPEGRTPSALYIDRHDHQRDILQPSGRGRAHGQALDLHPPQ